MPEILCRLNIRAPNKEKAIRHTERVLESFPSFDLKIDLYPEIPGTYQSAFKIQSTASGTAEMAYQVLQIAKNVGSSNWTLLGPEEGPEPRFECIFNNESSPVFWAHLELLPS